VRVSPIKVRSQPLILAFLLFFCVFALVVTWLAGIGVWDGVRAARATAEITVDKNPRGQSVVRFDGPKGVRCTSLVSYDPAAHGKRVGDRVQVRYTSRFPCFNVRAADDRTWWLYIFVPLALLTAGVVVTVVYWRKAVRRRR
jgi:hypothetical protein